MSNLPIAETFPDAPGGPVVLLDDGRTYQLTGSRWKPCDDLPSMAAELDRRVKERMQPSEADLEPLNRVHARLAEKARHA